MIFEQGLFLYLNIIKIIIKMQLHQNKMQKINNKTIDII